MVPEMWFGLWEPYFAVQKEYKKLSGIDAAPFYCVAPTALNGL